MKLDKIQTDRAFDYFYLLSRIWPYIRPVMFRIIVAFLLAIPLGLLDGATAFILKPYIEIVVNGNDFTYKTFTLTRDVFAAAIPWLIMGFAVVQGLLKYANSYLTDWISQKISISVS